MDATLFRYWFFPKRWRLWTDSKRFAFLEVLAIVTALLSFLPLLLLPAQIGKGIFGYLEEWLGILFFLIVNVACALAGATLITRERELGAWEALTLTPIGASAIVCGKWLARTLFTTGAIGLFVPFWLVFTAVVLYQNDGEERAYYTASDQMPQWWTAARLGIFLVWLAIRIVGHAVPFVSIGLLVSACCRKTRTAIAVTAGIVVLALPMTLYFLMSALEVLNLTVKSQGADVYNQFPVGFALSACGLWPILPNDFESFTAHSLISTHWASDLTADILWIVVLPAILLYCAARICSRTERLPLKRKVKTISHGV